MSPTCNTGTSFLTPHTAFQNFHLGYYKLKYMLYNTAVQVNELYFKAVTPGR